MKKLIQISLIVVFVCALFVAAAGPSMVPADQTGSSVADGAFFSANTSVEDAHASACLVYVKGVICVKPLVGWNS